jgi:hypothetical protein
MCSGRHSHQGCTASECGFPPVDVDPLAVVIDLLPRLWVKAGPPFKSLTDEAKEWATDLQADWIAGGRRCEQKLIDATAEFLDHLPTTQGEQVLVHQDLHGDNVLRAMREPWLVIDPKPLTAEREFSLAPIIRSFEFGHSRRKVVHRLDRLSAELQLDQDRVRQWVIAQTIAWSFDKRLRRPTFRDGPLALGGGLTRAGLGHVAQVADACSRRAPAIRRLHEAAAARK